MTNYRQVVHMSKIHFCDLIKNADNNSLMKDPIRRIKDSFPENDYNCPFKVNLFDELMSFCFIFIATVHNYFR